MRYSKLKRSMGLPIWVMVLLFLSLPSFAQQIAQKLAALEASADGRMGISAVNTANHQRIQYRAQERFPLGSTFKIMVVAAILEKSMTDKTLLQEKITYQQKDLVEWSPATEKHVNHGMTIFDLTAAAIMYSDNTATNLLIKKLGGPEAVNAFAGSIGDNVFKLEGKALASNANIFDIQPTSTPFAMEKSLQQLTMGTDLELSQREQLTSWMKDNTTGDQRIRAGVPKGWVVADKTGSGTAYGLTNDIGIIWPPQCEPILVAIYFIQNKKDAPRRPDILAQATRLLLAEFAKTSQCESLRKPK